MRSCGDASLKSAFKRWIVLYSSGRLHGSVARIEVIYPKRTIHTTPVIALMARSGNHATESEGGTHDIMWAPAELTFDDAHPRGIYTYVMKVASRCNIDCDYCFMFHAADQSWKTKPKIIAAETVQKAAERIDAHAAEWGLEEVLIAFHGGEPLLIGKSRLIEFSEILRNSIRCRVELGIQTNGMLVDEEWVALFERFGFNVGVSLDGDRTANDRHRLGFDGRTTFDKALNGLRITLNGKGTFGGLLTVLDIKNSPRALLGFVDGEGIRKLDLLLPDGNHSYPPPALEDGKNSTNYGDWLIEFYNIWKEEYAHIEVRYLEEIIKMMLGGISTLEAIGATNANLIIIETDGALEPVDSLKSAGRQATDIGMSVFANSIDEAMRHSSVYSRMLGKPGLCQKCQKCAFVDNCAGGYLPHRFSHEAGFLNPSVYCESLIKLFKHISTDLLQFET